MEMMIKNKCVPYTSFTLIKTIKDQINVKSTWNECETHYIITIFSIWFLFDIERRVLQELYHHEYWLDKQHSAIV